MSIQEGGQRKNGRPGGQTVEKPQALRGDGVPSAKGANRQRVNLRFGNLRFVWPFARLQVIC